MPDQIVDNHDIVHLVDGSNYSEQLAALGRDLVHAAYLRGDFVLSSGAHSNYYLDKYLFETKPDILRRITRFLARMLPPDVDRIAGTELGAVALATALSLETDIPMVIVRKTAKGHGTAHTIEGEITSGDRVVVVEDVVTTGAQVVGACDAVLRTSALVVQILAVVDRQEGGAEAISSAGYRFTALFDRHRLGI